MSLHERVARALGWSLQETQSFSLAALRELVREVNPKLAHELDHVIRTGGHLATSSESAEPESS